MSALAARPATAGDAVADETSPPSPELAQQGAELFGQICSHCHGIHMVNPGNSSFDLRKFPHDQRDRFFNSVTHGKGNMPPWGDILKPEEIEALWAYVRTGGKG
ncbi:MAG TPA: cytochrome c [Acetobacteraceae bacterium]|nr:cytochrome c [Acetobacteraceae bacterium]